MILGQQQLAKHTRFNLQEHVELKNWFLSRDCKWAREERAMQIEPMGAKGVAFIDAQGKKLVHVADYAAYLEGKESVFDSEFG